MIHLNAENNIMEKQCSKYAEVATNQAKCTVYTVRTSYETNPDKNTVAT